jgi:hypothetical protein
LQIDVEAIDSRRLHRFQRHPRLHRRANVVLGPGAGGLAGTTVSVPAGQTPQELMADLDNQMTDLEAGLDANLDDINSTIASVLANLVESANRSGRLLNQG